MKQPPSLLRRLEAGLVASLALTAGVLGLVGTLLLEQALRGFALEQLAEDARGVLAAVHRTPGGLVLDPARLAPGYRTPLSGSYFVVGAPGAQWRSRSLWDAELAVPAAPGPVDGLVDGPDDQRLLVLRADFRRHGQPLAITVATDVGPLTAEFRRIGLALAALAAACLLLLAWVQRLGMRRALLPLEAARAGLRELQEGRRDWLDETAPAELRPLVAEINRLLRQTRATLLRSRRALGNLGHALKTPLAVLQGIAERADPALRSQLEPQLLRMRQRIGRELGRARTAGDGVSGQRFEPQVDVPPLLETLCRAHGREPALRCTLSPGTLPLERDDMLELLGNLLDNAFKWSRGGIGLAVEPEADGIRIVVEDDGPGIPPDERARVLSHGVRLDEQVEGHGLGLGIVGDIVDSYSGTLALGESGTGGLRATVWLPAATA